MQIKFRQKYSLTHFLAGGISLRTQLDFPLLCHRSAPDLSFSQHCWLFGVFSGGVGSVVVRFRR